MNLVNIRDLSQAFLTSKLLTCRVSVIPVNTGPPLQTEERSADVLLFVSKRPNSKPGHDYERLKTQCVKAMADLQSLQNQHTKTLKRCEEAVKEADYYQWVSLTDMLRAVFN